MPPPFVTGFVHHRCVKISRHARQVLRIALPPLSLSISFNLSAFSSRSSANQHQRESRGTLEIEDSIISISSRGGKLKWSKIEECDRWRIFDILVYFYNIWLRIRWMDRFRYFSNILLLFERRNWSMINSIDLILIILDIYSWIIKLEDWSDIYIYSVEFLAISLVWGQSWCIYFFTIIKVIKIEKEKFFDLTSLKIPSLWWKLVSSFPISGGYR